jgi:hypothetical protein
MELSDDEFEAANRRGAANKAAFPSAVAVRYDRRISRIVISLSTGLDIAFAPRDVEGFEHARPADLGDAEITPSGLGIHFPKIDADIYVPALLEGFLGSKRWMAAQHGKAGGRIASTAKSAAARENGKLGGRPKKTKSLAEDIG